MIDARALHGWLGTKTRYTQWLQERITEYGFTEGEDFFRIVGKTGPKGGRPRTDYLLTLDMAKELAMVERTPIGHDLRTVELDGEPWFCGGDVLHILYGAASGQGHLYDKLSPDEVRKVKRLHLGLRGGRDVNAISESGLYKLIMRSDKDTARPFQDWVTKVVLPSIRRTGGYLLNENARETAHADTREAQPINPHPRRGNAPPYPRKSASSTLLKRPMSTSKQG